MTEGLSDEALLPRPTTGGSRAPPRAFGALSLCAPGGLARGGMSWPSPVKLKGRAPAGAAHRAARGALPSSSKLLEMEATEATGAEQALRAGGAWVWPVAKA